jgi:hypothetical protein
VPETLPGAAPEALRLAHPHKPNSAAEIATAMATLFFITLVCVIIAVADNQRGAMSQTAPNYYRPATALT